MAPARKVLWFWSLDIMQAMRTMLEAIDRGTGNMLLLADSREDERTY